MADRGRASLWLMLLATVLPAACGGSRENGPLDRGEAYQAQLIRYDVRIVGDMTDELRSFLREATSTQRLVDQPPASALVLRRRAEGDLDTLQTALRSRGFYDAQVSFEIRPAEAGGNGMTGQGGPLSAPSRHVEFRVVTGPVYNLGPVAVEAEAADPAFAVPTPKLVGLQAGTPAEAGRVLAAEQRLLDLTRRQSRPLARLGDRSTIVDHDRRAMEVTLRVEPGPAADIGPIVFAGDAGISETLLRRRLRFASGTAYDPELVAQGRRSLIDTNLFSSVLVELGDAVEADGSIPLTYRLRPRLHRTVGGGVSYQTDVGPGVNAYWENRNLLSAGERLRADLSLDPTDQVAQLSFRKPEIWIPRLALLAETAAEAQDTDAFKSESVRAGVGLEYQLTDRLLGSLGIAYRYADIDDAGDRQTFGLLSLPAGIDWDFSNDRLDPSSGGRLRLFGAPFADTLGSGTRFVKTQLVHTRYLSLLDDRRLVLALRGALGAVAGASRDDVPADERLYSGGGGSVRGVPFQLAGPLDDDDEPIGGRSNAEFSIEFRGRISDSIGAVAFLDGGSAFESSFPSFDEPLRLGTGAGLRYLTPVGPLRFDLGVPIERRKGIDDAVQFYISIGQAF